MRAFFHWLFAFLFPPRCFFCRTVVRFGADCCARCAPSLPLCADMRARSPQGAALCRACAAPFWYVGGVRAALLRMKHAEHVGVASFFAARMAALVCRAFPDTVFGLVVCVPNYGRGGKHAYNQARALAVVLARALKVPFADGLLEQSREKQRQHMLARADRVRNVQNVFRVPAALCAQARGKTVLLVDDIATTGATLEACAQALLDAGAAQIFAVTAAKTPAARGEP